MPETPERNDASQFVLRPVAENDLDALSALVESIPDTLTTLPNDAGYLAKKIDHSIRSFFPRIREPGGEQYFFVLEDTHDGRLIGTTGLIARVGGFEPFYTYELKHERFVDPVLEIDHEVSVLHLKKSHKGPSEICSLFLHPEYRRHGLGKLLSYARFLFMKTFPERFEDKVIAEMRGYTDPQGRSPFWEAVAKPFFQRDFRTADVLSGLGQKAFIEALMPRHPIYVNLLPTEAQSVIGHVHKDTEAALELLQRQGFRITREVDIFDAGPLVEAEARNIRAIRQASERSWVEDTEAAATGRTALVSVRRLDFRTLRTRAAWSDNGPVALPPEAVRNLRLQPGETINLLPLNR